MKGSLNDIEKKEGEPSLEQEDDVCMQDEKPIDSSPAEMMEKVPLSPLTWINPASDTANAQHSGHLNAEESSRDTSNLEREHQKLEAPA